MFFMKRFEWYVLYSILILGGIFALAVPPEHWLPFANDFPSWFTTRPIGIQIVEAPLFVIAVFFLAITLWISNSIRRGARH